MTPYTIRTDDPEFVLVTWSDRVPGPRIDDERALAALIRGGKPVLFDFSATRVIGTRWLRLMQRLTISADEMGKELLVVGLDAVLSAKADLIAIKGDLHVYATVEEARRR